MNDSYPSTLSVLQHADSMFPSGAFSFSWRLEAICNRSIIVESNRLFEFISAHLLSRWSCLDRPIIAHAHAAGNNTSILTELDRNLEAQSLSTEQRLGSTQMGGALLSVHARTGTPGASNYIDLIARQQAFGHIPVIQGLILITMVVLLCYAHGTIHVQQQTMVLLQVQLVHILFLQQDVKCQKELMFMVI